MRLAVTHGQAGLAGNSWSYYDFTPSLVGLTGKLLDFPHLQASANYLYFTTNIFTLTTNAFYGALIVRIPLAQLDAGGSVTFDYFLTTAFGSIAPVNGAQAEGARPGRTTMYFGAVFSTTSIQVLTWPEATTTVTVTSVTGLPAISVATFACIGPDGLAPCTRANVRMQTGWITDTELGFMFASAQNGASRPYPYTRVVILDPVTLAVLAQPDIFSTTSAWLYPALGVNERGHLGGTIDNLGGNVLPTIRSIIRDDLSPDVATSGWETYAVDTSTAGSSGLWGDYNGAMPHQRYPKTWLAVGHVQNGGPNDVNSVLHNYWFGRERDTNPTFTVTPAGTGTGTVTSSPAGINCGGSCTNGFALGTTVTLTATPGALSTFAGWSGACTGTGSCIVAVDGAKSVTATFTLQTFSLTVSKAGTGTGTVTSSPAGISCGGTCGASFNGGTTLTATPDANSGFTGWSGACAGTGSCMVTMDAAKAVTATFDLTPPLGLDYYTVTPCRVLDTRLSGTPLVSGVTSVFTAAGLCGVPADAVAVMINVTVFEPPSFGHVTLFPGDGSLPATSTLNFQSGVTRANNAIIPLATDAAQTLAAQVFLAGGGQAQLIVDVFGYFK